MRIFKKSISILIFSAFFAQAIFPAGVSAQMVLGLPAPGAMVLPTQAVVPPLLKGLVLGQDNPFEIDFLLDTGHADLTDPGHIKEESQRLIKYFLAALTTPEDEMWVNLSPYEQDRIIPSSFGDTEMGRDMLAQDYILKQLSASLMSPEKELGKKFWDRVYARAAQEYGVTQIPMDMFHKVWIVPERARVFADGNLVYILNAHLKVMLEEDYMALQAAHRSSLIAHGKTHAPSAMSQEQREITEQIMREVIIPEITKEVNEGEHFAMLRQIVHAAILAKWYKTNLKQSILNQKYADQHKVLGVDVDGPQITQKIYGQYLEALRKGVCDLIREDYDPVSKTQIPRRYFSGGTNIAVEIKGTNDRSEYMAEQADGRILRLPTRLQKVPESGAASADRSLSDEAVIVGGFRTSIGELWTLERKGDHIHFKNRAGEKIGEIQFSLNGPETIDLKWVKVEDDFLGDGYSSEIVDAFFAFAAREWPDRTLFQILAVVDPFLARALAAKHGFMADEITRQQDGLVVMGQGDSAGKVPLFFQNPAVRNHMIEEKYWDRFVWVEAAPDNGVPIYIGADYILTDRQKFDARMEKAASRLALTVDSAMISGVERIIDGIQQQINERFSGKRAYDSSFDGFTEDRRVMILSDQDGVIQDDDIEQFNADLRYPFFAQRDGNKQIIVHRMDLSRLREAFQEQSAPAVAAFEKILAVINAIDVTQIDQKKILPAVRQINEYVSKAAIPAPVKRGYRGYDSIQGKEDRMIQVNVMHHTNGGLMPVQGGMGLIEFAFEMGKGPVVAREKIEQVRKIAQERLTLMKELGTMAYFESIGSYKFKDSSGIMFVKSEDAAMLSEDVRASLERVIDLIAQYEEILKGHPDFKLPQGMMNILTRQKELTVSELILYVNDMLAGWQLAIKQYPKVSREYGNLRQKGNALKPKFEEELALLKEIEEKGTGAVLAEPKTVEEIKAQILDIMEQYQKTREKLDSMVALAHSEWKAIDALRQETDPEKIFGIVEGRLWLWQQRQHIQKGTESYSAVLAKAVGHLRALIAQERSGDLPIDDAESERVWRDAQDESMMGDIDRGRFFKVKLSDALVRWFKKRYASSDDIDRILKEAEMAEGTVEDRLARLWFDFAFFYEFELDAYDATPQLKILLEDMLSIVAKSNKDDDANSFAYRVGQLAFREVFSENPEWFNAPMPFRPDKERKGQVFLDIAPGLQAAFFLKKLKKRNKYIFIENNLPVAAFIMEAAHEFERDLSIEIRQMNVVALPVLFPEDRYDYVRMNNFDSYSKQPQRSFWKWFVSRVNAGGTISLEYTDRSLKKNSRLFTVLASMLVGRAEWGWSKRQTSLEGPKVWDIDAVVFKRDPADANDALPRDLTTLPEVGAALKRLRERTRNAVRDAAEFLVFVHQQFQEMDEAIAQKLEEWERQESGNVAKLVRSKKPEAEAFVQDEMVRREGIVRNRLKALKKGMVNYPQMMKKVSAMTGNRQFQEIYFRFTRKQQEGMFDRSSYEQFLREIQSMVQEIPVPLKDNHVDVVAVVSRLLPQDPKEVAQKNIQRGRVVSEVLVELLDQTESWVEEYEQVRGQGSGDLSRMKRLQSLRQNMTAAFDHMKSIGAGAKELFLEILLLDLIDRSPVREIVEEADLGFFAFLEEVDASAKLKDFPLEKIRQFVEQYRAAVSEFNHGLDELEELVDGQVFENISPFLPSDALTEDDDEAMLSVKESDTVPKQKGGIDLNPGLFTIDEQGPGVDIPVPSDPAQWQDIEIDGLVPYILDVTPVPSLPMLLGEALSDSEMVLSSLE